MPGSLPETIDPIQLADQGVSLEGQVALSLLGRLKSLCLDDQGQVDIALHFERSAQGVRHVRGALRVQLLMTCQRCLQPMEQVVSTQTFLVLLPADSASAPDLQAADVLEIAGPIDLYALVEDELLLAMPMMPRHNEQTCRAWTARPSKPAGGNAQQLKPNPFALLDNLKRTKK